MSDVDKHSEKYPYKVYLSREEMIELYAQVEEKYGKMHLDSNGNIHSETYGIGMYDAKSVWLGFADEKDAVLFRLTHESCLSPVN